jgi:flagellar biosynthesis/type III secretory pathway chaperone
MNPGDEGILKELFQQMEEEIFFYHLLAEEMKKESEYLRKGSTTSLMESLQLLEVQTTEIRKIHESIRRSIERIWSTMEGKEGKNNLSSLLPLLPPQDSQRIKDYQRTLGGLKKRITQINTRNKTFVQGSLAYWRELFSLLTQPLAESPVYIQNGKTQSPTHLPISLNRKV